MAFVIAEEVVSSLGARSAHVHLADENGATLRLVASRGAGAHRGLDVIALDAPVPAARFGAPDVPEPAGILRPCTSGPAPLVGCEAETFAFPLLAGDRLVGAVSGEFARSFESEDSATLASLGQIVGAMLDRAQRIEEAKARAEWSRVVLHEIRQPLGAMLMAASALGAVDPPSSRFVQRVQEAVKRVDRLLGDFLDPTVLDVASVSRKRGADRYRKARLRCCRRDAGRACRDPRRHWVHRDRPRAYPAGPRQPRGERSKISARWVRDHHRRRAPRR